MRSKHCLVSILLALFIFCSISHAQRYTNKKSVLKSMELTNDYFMQKWPDAGSSIIHPDKARPANIWTRAVYYEGLMALYSINPRKDYLDYALDWGQKHNWNPAYDQMYTRHADNQACGQTYIDLYLIDHDPHKIVGIKSSIDAMMSTNKIDDWSWIDAIQMAMPVFARLGFVYQDTSYYWQMFQMYLFARDKQGINGLYNPQEGLWWRDRDFVPPYREPNGKNCYWSRGNGWVMAALVRTMDFLPESSSYYSVYLDDFRKMAAALVPIQRKDGYWNVSLHDPDNFGGKELSGTALFTYCIAWGINKGYLNRTTYLPVVLKAWDAMVKYSVHSDGMLGYVQGTGKEPKDGQPVTYDHPANFEDYGLGCFLLAGSEIYKLVR
jgi:unsaturated rhamnogalacturonyl hydrolase